MKTTLLLSTLILFSLATFSQSVWDLNFEDTTTLHKVVIQSKVNGSNNWQIGKPGKPNLNRPYSERNVIVTDTLDSYPVNDTSSFIIVHQASEGWHFQYPKIDLNGWYYVNSDSLTDFGFIEFSLNNGISWFSADSAQNNGCCTWSAVQEMPVLTGNSYDWKPFSICICPPGKVEFNDTILYRFTFISDGIDTQKDGLMFDNFHFEDWAEGEREYHQSASLSISPNPVNHFGRIDFDKSKHSYNLEIFNLQGKCVIRIQDYQSEIIDFSQLPEGMYLAKTSGNGKQAYGKLLIQRK